MGGHQAAVQPAPLLLTVTELGRIIRRSKWTVYRMVEAGELPFQPVPGVGVTQFRRTDVEAWLGAPIGIEDLV